MNKCTVIRLKVPEEEYLIPIGVADIKRAGNDVTLVSFGKIIKTCYAAAEELEKEGISAEIIDFKNCKAYRLWLYH